MRSKSSWQSISISIFLIFRPNARWSPKYKAHDSAWMIEPLPMNLPNPRIHIPPSDLKTPPAEMRLSFIEPSVLSLHHPWAGFFLSSIKFADREGVGEWRLWEKGRSHGRLCQKSAALNKMEFLMAWGWRLDSLKIRLLRASHIGSYSESKNYQPRNIKVILGSVLNIFSHPRFEFFVKEIRGWVKKKPSLFYQGAIS